MAFSNGYDYRRKITIDETKVSGSSHTNFPVYVSLTLNKDHVAHGSGHDIIFTDLSDTQLDHEVMDYNASTGAWKGWVKVPTLSGSVDTELYVYYGNSSISTSQSDAAGLWDNYELVVHGHTVVDSSGTIHPLFNVGTSTTSGKLHTARTFNGSSQRIEVPNDTAYQGATTMSFSMWVNVPSITRDLPLMSRCDSSIHGFLFFIDNVVYASGANDAVSLTFSNDSGGSEGGRVASSDNSVATNQWVYISGVFQGSDSVRAYINGAPNGVETSGTKPYVAYSPSTSQRAFFIGDCPSEASPFRWFQGSMESIKISTSQAFSADWVATEYANQNSPGTFYSIGSEDDGSGGGDPVNGFKVWTGSSWEVKPVKVWDGSSWVEKPLKRWNGSSWVGVEY